jgi:DNA-directed RNA polymerase specialized sigma24 family protein
MPVREEKQIIAGYSYDEISKICGINQDDR